METLKLIPPAGRAGAVAETSARGARSRTDATIAAIFPTSADESAIAGEPPHAERIGREAFDGLAWTWRNGFDRVLRRVSATTWASPERQGWQHVKQNAKRDVWRAVIEGQTFFLKYYAAGGWRNKLKRVLRGPACQAEWNGGIFALSAGIAAVRPAGYTESVRVNGREYSLLVTEAIEPAHPLDQFWDSLATDADAKRRRQDAAQIIERLADLIARAHQSGFEHLDMHAANILVQPVAARRYRTVFVDLQSARLGVPLADAAVVRNLAQLNQWFRRHASIGDRLRFLRAYLRRRNEYETAFPHGRPLALSFERLVRALAIHAEKHADRLCSQRDRRLRRDGRYFARVKLPGGWRGMAYVQSKRQFEASQASGLVFERKWWKAQLSDPLRWFAPNATQVCKLSHSGLVTRAVLPLGDDGVTVIIKRPIARNWQRKLRQLVPPSRSLRGWLIGHALLHREIPAARPLAVLQRRVGPLVRDSILITEALPGALDLEAFLRREFAEIAPREWQQAKRSLCTLLVRELRKLVERGFVHRDCKAQNILVVPHPEPHLFWIDMDGIKRAGRFARRDALRALMRLHVSLLDVPGLTRTDRLRFLKGYLARFGTPPDAWKGVWRELAALSVEKLKARQARRAWKIEHYGRE